MTKPNRPSTEEVKQALKCSTHHCCIIHDENKIIATLSAECRYLQEELTEQIEERAREHRIANTQAERACEAESELSKTKQEFERFAARAVLDAARKDQYIDKLEAVLKKLKP